MNRVIDRLLTLLMLALLGWAGLSGVHWLLFAADWTVVTANLPLYAVGGYPPDQRWRPLVWIALLILMTAITLMGPRPRLAASGASGALEPDGSAGSGASRRWIGSSASAHP